MKKEQLFETISDCIMDLITNESITSEEIEIFLKNEILEIHNYFNTYSKKSEQIINTLNSRPICDV